MRIIASIALVALLWAAETNAAETTRIECTPSTGDARFRRFSTDNIWTVLELDTQTGRLWQVQASTGGNRLKSVPSRSRISAGPVTSHSA
jgi:hypothetical protein